MPEAGPGLPGPASWRSVRSRMRDGGRAVASRGDPGTPVSSGSGGADPGASLTPLERASLVLGEPTPDPGVLARAQGPVQTRLHHRAAPAHGLRLLDLDQGRAGRPDGEEQLWVLVPAERAVAPVHGCVLLGVVSVGWCSVADPDRGAGPTPVPQRCGSATSYVPCRHSFVTGELRSTAMFSREGRLSSESRSS